MCIYIESRLIIISWFRITPGNPGSQKIKWKIVYTILIYIFYTKKKLFKPWIKNLNIKRELHTNPLLTVHDLQIIMKINKINKTRNEFIIILILLRKNSRTVYSFQCRSCSGTTHSDSMNNGQCVRYRLYSPSSNPILHYLWSAASSFTYSLWTK